MERGAIEMRRIGLTAPQECASNFGHLCRSRSTLGSKGANASDRGVIGGISGTQALHEARC